MSLPPSKGQSVLTKDQISDSTGVLGVGKYFNCPKVPEITNGSIFSTGSSAFDGVSQSMSSFNSNTSNSMVVAGTSTEDRPLPGCNRRKCSSSCKSHKKERNRFWPVLDKIVENQVWSKADNTHSTSMNANSTAENSNNLFNHSIGSSGGLFGKSVRNEPTANSFQRHSTRRRHLTAQHDEKQTNYWTSK